MFITELNNKYYIGNDFVECLTGKLSGKTYEVIAVTKNKEFNCEVQADSIDLAQQYVVDANRNSKTKFYSFRITLLNNRK